MPDILVLLPEHLSRGEVLELQDRDAVRAVAFGDLGGGYGALAMVSTASLVDGADAASLLCPGDPSLMDCLSGLMIPLPVVPSSHIPGEYNVFAIIALYGGRQAAFKRHLLGAAEPRDGVRDARALVLGMDGVHAVVEVVGDDLDAVTERLFELVEHDDVADIRTFVTHRDSTRGFGEAKALRPRRSAKKTGARRARG